MIEYEYCEVEVAISGGAFGVSAKGWIFKEDGNHETLEGKQGPLFARLGKGGWKLIAASARPRSERLGQDRINYIFMREAQ